MLHNAKSRIAVLTAVFFGLVVSASHAAVDPATGIDWSTVGSDVLTSARPAILAGLAIMAVVLAITLGRKLFQKVAR